MQDETQNDQDQTTQDPTTQDQGTASEKADRAVAHSEVNEAFVARIKAALAA